MWHCNHCKEKANNIEIHWGMNGNQKVDVIDYFCVMCGSTDVEFKGTQKELDEYWDKEWNK